VKDIRTNVYAIEVAPTVAQFFLDPYVATSYYTSYLTKNDKSIMNEFQTIIKKCQDENIDVN